MTNEVETKIAQFAAKEETKAKAWFGSNLFPFSIGAGVALVIVWLVHLL